MTEHATPLTMLGPFVALAQSHPAFALGAAFLLPLVVAVAYLALRRSAGAPAPMPQRPTDDAAPAPTEPAQASAPVLPTAAQLPAEAVTRRPSRLRERLARTSQALVGRIEGIIGGRTLDAQLLDELESLLFTADLGVKTAESLLETVRRQAAGADLKSVRRVLRGAILQKLHRVEPAPGSALAIGAKPHVILVLGVNGSGKTTTIGKLAARHAALGRKVVLGAADTFRAAASEQLQIWGERVGCEVIVGKPGG